MADYITPISDLANQMPKITGGRWGAKASVEIDGQTVEARGADKTAALMGLLADLQKRQPAAHELPDFSGGPVPPPVVGRSVAPSKAYRLSLLSNSHQEGEHDGRPASGCPECQTAKKAPTVPKGKENTTKAAGKPRACDVSCLFAHSSVCVCQCEGENHQTGWVLFGTEKVGKSKVAKIEEQFDGPGRKKGGRECACGCGGMTSGGRFRQGHDRKLHVALGAVVDGTGMFKEEDSVGLVLTPLGRKTLREARNA